MCFKLELIWFQQVLCRPVWNSILYRARNLVLVCWTVFCGGLISFQNVIHSQVLIFLSHLRLREAVFATLQARRDTGGSHTASASFSRKSPINYGPSHYILDAPVPVLSYREVKGDPAQGTMARSQQELFLPLRVSLDQIRGLVSRWLCPLQHPLCQFLKDRVEKAPSAKGGSVVLNRCLLSYHFPWYAGRGNVRFHHINSSSKDQVLIISRLSPMKSGGDGSDNLWWWEASKLTISTVEIMMEA